MKVGILTFHRAYNYGAVLQAYALQKTLTELGYDAFVIDYKCDAVYDDYKIIRWDKVIRKNPIKMLSQLMRELRHVPIKTKKSRAFKPFIEKQLHLFPLSKIGELDVLIVGSDQVWNPNITRGFNNLFFGQICEGKFPLVSYAASSEFITLTQTNENNYRDVLSRFNSISVRESGFARYLQKLTTKPVQTVLDPTLLMNCNQWKEFTNAIKIRFDNYVLVYQARVYDKIIPFAKEIASQIGAKVLVITSNVTSIVDDDCIVISNATPQEFVRYFIKARCAIALSFHAVAFSILSKIPFYAIYSGDGWDNRVASLLTDLGLLNRFVSINSDVDFSVIDYTSIDLKLLELRRISIEWIRSSLNKLL